jgi:hypothetical protein
LEEGGGGVSMGMSSRGVSSMGISSTGGSSFMIQKKRKLKKNINKVYADARWNLIIEIKNMVGVYVLKYKDNRLSISSLTQRPRM